MKASSRITIAATMAIVIGSAFYFEPWTLFTSSTIDEDLPQTTQSLDTAESDPETSSDTQTEELNSAANVPAEEPEPAPSVDYPITLSSGELISHEHETSGTVKILELEDGSRVLRLEDLKTSDGPQLEVWITNAPVIEGFDGWFVFDDDIYQSLGDLKATEGNQNYEIPAELKLEDFSSLSIWCSRFAVSFGAASLL